MWRASAPGAPLMDSQNTQSSVRSGIYVERSVSVANE